MRLQLYVIDAFTSRVFAGNPAAVCPLPRWLDERVMQAIAAENNLAETAFFVPRPQGDGFDLRWFTPVTEVDLCGHATLASAFVLFRFLEPGRSTVRFWCKGGELGVDQRDDRLVLDFPATPGRPVPVTDAITEALGTTPDAALAGRDLMVVLGSESQVRDLRPRVDRIAALPFRGLIATAPGAEPGTDFVSRFFAPAVGVPEDPVTGSAHCALTPFWSARLGKKRLHARQVSRRGGELWCEDLGARVTIAGHAACYLQGAIDVP